MPTKPFALRDYLWMAGGAVALLGVVLLALHFHNDLDRMKQLADKARRLELVERVQADLVAASEAEKSAVLAITDEASQLLADQARTASAKVELERSALGDLLAAGGTTGEKDLLAQFTTAFAEFQKIDNDLLALAVKNTNIKAYDLTYGPANLAIKDMNQALGQLAAAQGDAPVALMVLRRAYGAQLGVLHIQTMLPPHIAEENDKRMDELEAAMSAEDAQVRACLEELGGLLKSGRVPELVRARESYALFSQLRKKIIALSRENTNVRSLSLSLNQKRKVMQVCQGLLGALQQAILAEPIAGNAAGAAVNPRGF